MIAGLGIRTAALRLGAAQITLAAPASDSGPAGLALREHLAVRGEGPYAVAFATASSVAAQTLDQARAYGARLELVDHSRTPLLT